jgi:hypothetical protein
MPRHVWFQLLPIAFCAVAISLSTIAAAELSADKTEKGATVKIDGKPFAEYVIDSGKKPIVWPIIGPTGKAMTRAYPMEAAKDTKDHPHHRSLWFSHGDVNGIDFWTEGNGKGTVKHQEFVKVQGGKTAVIITRNNWLGPDGKKVLEDERTFTFAADENARWIDFDITLKASEGKVKFGDTKEGTFGMRVPDTMRVDSKKGGRIVNSKGQTDDAAWGVPAEWVDYSGPVDGENVGIAIFDHPSSFKSPTYWHVRTYGLFAANPFGLQDFPNGAGKDGSATLAQGETMKFRYRIYLHKGDEKIGKVSEAYAVYAKETK